MNTRHIDVGAYALGLLEEPDRRAFEAHLATCANCHRELAELRGVAAALDGMPLMESLPETPATDAAIVTDLVQRRAGMARRQRRSRVLLSAAAGVVLLAGGAGMGMTLADGGDGGGAAPGRAPVVAAPPADSAQALLTGGERREAADPGTGVTGVVAWESKMWGARVALRLSKVRGPLECRLIAVGPDGRTRVVTGWAVPDKGYGVPGSPAPLTVQGGVALQPAEIERFEIRTGDGRTLLTVPTRG